MKRYIDHTLRFLALLALVPCARALTVTQSMTFSGSRSGSGNSNLVTIVKPMTFAPANDGLIAVVVDFQIQGEGTITEMNPFGFPMTYSPTIGVWSYAYLNNSLHTKRWDFGMDSNSEGEVTIPPSSIGNPPLNSHTFTSTFGLQDTIEITSPEELAKFTGAPPFVQLFSEWSSFGSDFGGWTMTHTSTLELTYVYAAPDRGVTALLLAGALCGIVAAHRRMKPGIDRLPPAL